MKNFNGKDLILLIVMVYGNKINNQFMFIQMDLRMEIGLEIKRKYFSNCGKIILKKN
jgi:hypothetical protein